MQEKNISNTVFRQRLRQSMGNNSLTQMKLQELSGISQGAISDYLKGKSEPKAAALYQLSRIFGVSMEWLWGESDHEQNDFNLQSDDLASARLEITRLRNKLKSATQTLEGAYKLALEALKLEE